MASPHLRIASDVSGTFTDNLVAASSSRGRSVLQTVRCKHVPNMTSFLSKSEKLTQERSVPGRCRARRSAAIGINRGPSVHKIAQSIGRSR